MGKPYEQLTFTEKAIYHVRKAEEYQTRAEALEARAEKNSSNPELAARFLDRPYDSREAFQYKQVTGTRNGHQQRAIMYSLVALLERAHE